MVIWEGYTKGYTVNDSLLFFSWLLSQRNISCRMWDFWSNFLSRILGDRSPANFDSLTSSMHFLTLLWTLICSFEHIVVSWWNSKSQSLGRNSNTMQNLYCNTKCKFVVKMRTYHVLVYRLADRQLRRQQLLFVWSRNRTKNSDSLRLQRYRTVDSLAFP